MTQNGSRLKTKIPNPVPVLVLVILFVERVQNARIIHRLNPKVFDVEKVAVFRGKTNGQGWSDQGEFHKILVQLKNNSG